MEASAGELTSAAQTTSGNAASLTETGASALARSGMGRYGSSYSGLLGGGMGGMGMYGGMGGLGSMGGLGGMGMYGGGLGSMGLGGMGATPGAPGQNGPRGFRQDYQTFFNGLRNLFQILYSGLGLFSFGKLFGSMVLSMVKSIVKKLISSGKWVIGALFMNRVSAKIINGAVERASAVSDSPNAASSIFVKALFAVAILGTSTLWFLQREDSIAERERILKAQVELRRREEELKRQREEEKHREEEELRLAFARELEMRSSTQPFLFPVSQQQEVVLEAAFENAIKTQELKDEAAESSEKNEEMEKAIAESQEIVRAHQMEVKVNDAQSSDSECDEISEPHGASSVTLETGQEQNDIASGENINGPIISGPDAAMGATPVSPTKKRRRTRRELKLVKIGNCKHGNQLMDCKTCVEERAMLKKAQRKTRVQVSEELGNNRFRREIQAFENGSSLEKLFLGTLGEVEEIRKASESDKSRWMSRLSSSSFFSKAGEVETPELTEAPTLSHTTSLQTALESTTPTLEVQPLSTSSTPELTVTDVMNSGVFQKKKKPWE